MMRFITRLLLPVLILTAAFVATKRVREMAPKAARSAPKTLTEVVEVLTVEARTLRPRLSGTGHVRPAREVTLSPEVGGRIVEISTSLVPGGRFVTGELMMRIDDRDYAFAVVQEKSRVQAAELELEMEKSRRSVAGKEWALLGEDRPDANRSLALREPHLLAAKAALEAARSMLARARLQLDRTRIVAPFNCVVIDESVDVGQLIGPSVQAARLYGTDRAWVLASLPVESLSALSFPAQDDDPGPEVRVIQRLGEDRQFQRLGELRRLVGRLDPATRRAQLLVEVEGPYDRTDGQPPLLPDSFVRVEMDGLPMDDVILLPRSTLHQGHWVWILDTEDRLTPRKVRVVWGDGESLHLSGELTTGDRVVVSPMSNPISGRKVAVASAAADSPKQEDLIR